MMKSTAFSMVFVAALLSPGFVYAQSSLVLNGITGSYRIPDASPWNALGNVRLEFRIHEFTIPATTVSLFSTGRIGVSLLADGRLRVGNNLDSGVQGDSTAVPVSSRSDVTVRVQRDVSNKQMTVEVWDTDGAANYAKATILYTTMGTGSWAGQPTIGSANVRAKLAWIHMSRTLVDLGSPPPSQHGNGEIAQWDFEDTLTDPVSSLGVSMTNAQFAPTPVYNPVPAPVVSGIPAWMHDTPIVRAGQTVRLVGSKSLRFDTGHELTFLWRQVDGPSKILWSDTQAADPSIEGLVFGEYSLRLTVTDSAGRQGSKDISFGAVPSDDNGVVATGDPNIDFVFGPLIRFGASPWIWHDQNHRDLANTYGRLVTDASGLWSPDWNQPLQGTVSVARGSRTVTGQGTSFQRDFCGAPGATAPMGSYTAIVFRNGAQTHAGIVSSCTSDTQILLSSGEENLVPTWTNVAHAKTLNGTWWGGAVNGSGGSNNANYYDNVMAHYALYYRSGLKKYLDYARTLADRWYDSPFFLRSASPPRVWSLGGILWRAYEGKRTNWWTDKLHPHLDNEATRIQTGTVGDARESAYRVAFVSIGSKLTEDTGRADAYKQAVIKAAWNVWAPQRSAAGVWLSSGNSTAAGNGTGTATVTKDSTTVTGTGTNWTSSWPWASSCFWIGDNSLSGDPVTYRATWISATEVTLDRPYEGASASSKKWQLSNLCGGGVQPFMMGVVTSAWSYAYQVTGDAVIKDLVTKTARWILKEGIQSTSKGLYYGRLFVNCEPITDYRPGCSYDPASASAVEASRVLSGEVLGGLAMASLIDHDPGTGAKGDMLFGAAFGKLGGPQSDSIHASLLHTSMNGSAPKNFGFFHGFGRAAVWPAARVGGLAAPQVKSVNLATRMSDVPGTAQLRVKTTSATNQTGETFCDTAPCPIAIDVSRDGHVVTAIEYLDETGKVLSSTEPFTAH